MMSHIDLGESDLVVDLESGGTTGEEDGSKDLVLGGKQSKKLLGRAWSGFVGLDGSKRGGDGVGSRNNVLNSGETSIENVEIVSDKLGVEYVEKNFLNDKRKKASSKRPPKPPRPPRGLSLDASDMKLVREISELAMLKRARVERMKALKKMRAHKASSSTSNFFAMIITILFIFVIIYQGMFSKSNPSVSLHGSPESALVAKGGVIQVEHFKSPSASETNGPGSRFPNDIEQVSGAGLEEEIHGVAG